MFGPPLAMLIPQKHLANVAETLWGWTGLRALGGSFMLPTAFEPSNVWSVNCAPSQRTRGVSEKAHCMGKPGDNPARALCGFAEEVEVQSPCRLTPGGASL
jgi:hypothetical protein